MSTSRNPRLFTVQQEQLTSDDYYTPAWVFDRMGIEFDVDVCSPPGGVDWVPAKRHFTQADDGLAQPWTGRVWMNPPYSNCAPWAERFIQHRDGVALVQSSKSAWCGRLFDTADGVVFMGALPFVGQDIHRATRAVSVFMPILAVAFGDKCVDAISRLGVVRRIA